MSPRPEPRSPTLYERLALSPDATPAEITAAYRRLLLASHPDSAQADADPQTLQDVIAAHRVLADAERRREYDQTLARVAHASDPAAPSACAVCKGAGEIATPCPRCSGVGYHLFDTPWLRTPTPCPACGGHAYQRTPCGACDGSGRQV